jgi:hypothetical protein
MASLFTPPFLDVGAGITPADGALLNFHVPGSGTNKDTFTTAAATTPHANPVVADTLGVFPAIYIQGDYDWVLTDKNAVQKNTGSVSEFVTGSGQENNVLARTTLNDAVIDTSLQSGLVITVGDRGASTWDVVLSSTVTPNTYNIVQCTGVGTLALVARVPDDFPPEIFGVDGTGVIISTAGIQASVNYAKAINGFCRGLGKYLIDDTITATGGRYGFQFGVAPDIFNDYSTGLVWGGVAGDDTNEDTVTPMLLMEDSQFVECGTISLSNRNTYVAGIGGIKFKATNSSQYSHNHFPSILCAGMDNGMIVGTRGITGDNDDVLEQSIVGHLYCYQVKHPLIISGRTNDKIRFMKVSIIGYQSGVPSANGNSDYAIRVDSVGNGLEFDDVLISQHTLINTDINLIDVIEGDVKFGEVSVEGGYAKARAMKLANTSGASRSPNQVRSLAATNIKDSTGVSVILDSRLGQQVGCLSVQGDIQCDSMTWGSVLFRAPTAVISSITRVSTTATATSAGHYHSNGDSVEVKGASQSDYNITATISNVTTDTYDYTVAGSPTTPATGTITDVDLTNIGFLTGAVANHNLEVYRDSDGDTNIEGFNYGYQKAQRFQANGSGFLQVGNVKQGAATASSSLLSSGVAYNWATITIPATGAQSVAVFLDFMMFRGTAGANAASSGSVMYIINRTSAGTIAVSSTSDAQLATEEITAFSSTITDIVTTVSTTVATNDVQLEIMQTTTAANSMRCIFSYKIISAEGNSSSDIGITINAS